MHTHYLFCHRKEGTALQPSTTTIIYSLSHPYILHHPLLWYTRNDNYDNNNNYPYKIPSQHSGVWMSSTLFLDTVFCVPQRRVKASNAFPPMKLTLHLILIHSYVLERFIQDNFLPREFLGCKCSIANHSACLKMPYNRFFLTASLLS